MIRRKCILIDNRKFGWGGRIRTYTIRINSAVSYRLDHAPADSSHPFESLKDSRSRQNAQVRGEKIIRAGSELPRRLASLLAAGGKIWAVYVASVDYASLLTLRIMPPGPIEVCGLGILAWLHAKWRRSLKAL